MCIFPNSNYYLKCYKNEHSFDICHWTWSSKFSCKISRRYDQPFSRKWRLKWLFLVVFRIFPNGNCHFLPGVWKAGCDVARLYVLQSYRSCTFCKRKTRGETQFWIELAAPYTLANNNDMNSDDRLPFIIFLTYFAGVFGYEYFFQHSHFAHKFEWHTICSFKIKIAWSRSWVCVKFSYHGLYIAYIKLTFIFEFESVISGTCTC